MPKKRTPASPDPNAELAVPRADAAKQISERIELGKKLLAPEVRTPDEFRTFESACTKWSRFNKELLRRLFTTRALEEEYSAWAGIGSIPLNPSLGERLESIRETLTDELDKLESIHERLELIPESSPTRAGGRISSTPSSNRRVFLVHGHDEQAREKTARFIEKLGLVVVILHEQTTAGRTVIEKLEEYSDVGFAVVLLTPDDVGASRDQASSLQPRARQNVVLELGYFIAKLGRDRVCALYRGPLELPTDYLGVVYVEMDAGDGWRLRLARELRGAGFAIDMNEAL